MDTLTLEEIERRMKWWDAYGVTTFLATDGELLCEACIRDNIECVTDECTGNDWHVVARFSHAGCEEPCVCAHCDKTLCNDDWEATKLYVTTQQLYDLLITAMEGGIGYWGIIAHCKCGPFPPDLPDSERDFTHGWAPLSDGGSLTLEDSEAIGGNEPEFAPVVLTRENLTQGLKLARTKHPNAFADFVSDNLDADGADVIVQLAVFGDVVYG